MHVLRLKYISYVLIASLCFLSCNTPNNPKRAITYFGGEIVNPNTDYVVLSKDSNSGDTTYLDKNNRFLFTLTDFEEGLYSFRHNPENQLVILEKGDSLLIRLNTLEFDESLVFTGDGAKKNNFLIDMFLQNEVERSFLDKSDFRKPPSQFQKKQDSMLALRSERFRKLVSKHPISDMAYEICKSSYEYDFYARYEMYFYRYQYSGLGNIESFKHIPPTFFEYRNQVNFNNSELKRLYSYYRFLNHYFINTAYTNYRKPTSGYYKNMTGYTMCQLDLVDSTIQHSYIKNNLLRGITTKFMLDNKNNYTIQKVLNHYLKLSTNTKFKKELKKLADATAKLKPDNLIPDQDLISSDGETVSLQSLFKKPMTALYFWSLERKNHYIKAHTKTDILSQRYADIDFIAINTDDEQTKNWIQTIKRNRYTLSNEYEFKFPKCSSEELVIHDANKVILVDQYGKIINANADLFSPFLDNQLRNYLRILQRKNNSTTAQ